MSQGFSPIVAVMMAGVSKADIEKRLAILDESIASMAKDYQIITQTITALEKQMAEVEKDQSKQYYMLEANVQLRLELKAYMESMS